MPIVEDVRGYAQAASIQGKAALTQVSTVLHTASERISNAVDEAPRPDHLALGAAEVSAEAIARYAETAARRARTRVAKRQSDAAAARAAARKTVEAYFESAKDAYAAVSSRGEARAATLSTEDLMAKLRDELSAAPGAVRARLEPALQSLLSSTIEVISSQVAKPAKDAPPSATRAASPPARATAPAKKATPAKKTEPAKSAAPARKTAQAAKAGTPGAATPKTATPKTATPKTATPKTATSKATAAKKPAAGKPTS